VTRGVLIGFLLHLWQVVLIPAMATIAGMIHRAKPNDLDVAGLMFALGTWSVTQFVYLGPAAWIASRKGDKETAKGMMLLAAVGVLLNGACDALLFSK
jgi:hypothetical protein